MKNLCQEFIRKYTILSVLHEKETYSLYEVRENQTEQIYIVKYYRLNLFWQALGSLKQQLEKLAADETEFLPAIYDIGEAENELYVVTEKVEGYKLSDLINQKEKFEVAWVLKLIMKIAEGIRYFSKNNIGMYMINPNNILVQGTKNSEEVSVKFIEMVSSDYIEEKDNDFMMEQAVYMAPEQLGITRRKFDVRSDLYSLGVLAYQLFVGRLPFRAKTLNQYMYLQIAQVPSAVSQYNLEVKGSLDQMVQCLLEKDPNNRYQSIESLLYDIREYLEGNTHFEVNAYDSISKIIFREKDFLPWREMESLEALIKNGKGYISITGEANSGKSVVVDIVKLYVQEQKNTMIYAECGNKLFRLENLWNLLLDYVKVFETYPLRRQDILRQEIHKRSNIDKDLVCRKNALFAIFFDNEANFVSKHSGSEEQQLLELWSSICVVEEHIMVLLEKVNLDEEGKRLLDKFYSCFDIMFLCVSSRRYTVKNDNFDLEFRLCRLTKENILESLERVTSHRLEDAQELADYVFRRSRGNIYLSTEVANWLFTKEALTYREGRWRTNPLVLFDLGLPSDISAEIISRHDELSASATKMLYILATVQGQLPWTYIKRVAELEGIATDEVIEELKKNQYVEEKIKDTIYVTFTDKAIYDFFRSQLSKADIRSFSEKIAQVLEAEYIRFHKAEEAIAMNQYHLAAQNNEKIKEYSFEVAMFLKNQGRNSQAIDVLNGFLYSLEYQDDDIIWFYKAQKIAGEIYIAEGKPEEAEKTFEELLKLELNSQMRADILEERSWVAFYKGNFLEALNFAKAVMKEKKQYFPESNFSVSANIFWQMLVRLFQHMMGSPKEKQKKQGDSIRKKEVNQKIWWVSLLVDIRYFTYFSLKSTNHSWYKYGKSKELAISYFNLGQVLLATPFRKLANKYLQNAAQMTEEVGDDQIRIISYTVLAYQREVLGDYEGQLNYALMALQLHQKIQVSPFYGMTINAIIHAYNYLGDFSNMLRYNDFYQKRAIETGDNYGIISSDIYYLQYHRGQANFTRAVEYGEKALRLAEATQDYFDQFCCCAEMGKTYYFANKDELAIQYFEKALEIKKNRYFPAHYTLFAESYYVMVLCRKQRRIQQNIPQDSSLYPKIRAYLRQALKGKKYPTYYGAALRAKAEWHIVLGNHRKAKKYFKESIDWFIKYKRQWLVAVNQMEFGKYLEESGENMAAMQEFILAEYNFRNLNCESYALVAQRELENLQAGVVGMDSEFDKFQRRLNRERKNMFFTDLIRDLSSVLDFRELIQKIIMVLLEASGAQQVAVFLPEEGTNRLRLEEFYSNENDNPKNKEERIQELPMNLIRTVQQTKEILVLENAEKSEYIKIDARLLENRVKSMMIMPVCYKNSIRAIYYLENSLSTGIFTNEVVENMKVIANQIAVSMENAMLYKIATTDDLTGLYTRKHFDYLFQEELRVAKESGNRLGVVFIDIDKFKSINDTYGHIVGDKVLIEFAKFLKSNCRMTDVIGRFGGEEIILLLRGSAGQESYQFAERLRNKLEKFTMDAEEHKLNITASFGISSFPEHGDSMVELINKADTALYRSKNEGRNRVTIAK